LERAGDGAAAVGLDLAARLAAEAATLAQGVVLRHDGDLAAMDRLCAALSAGLGPGGTAGASLGRGGGAGASLGRSGGLESAFGGAAGPERALC
jgi:hypothetical protein